MYLLKQVRWKNIINSLKNNKNIKEIWISKQKIKPIIDFDLKQILYNKILDPVNMSVPFGRIFVKMAMEYICKKFGNEIVLQEKFDVCRKLLDDITTPYDSYRGFTYKSIYPYEPEKMKSVKHVIGIKYDENTKHWLFMFSLYNIIDYYVSVPNDGSYKEIIEDVNLYRNDSA